MKYSFSQGFTLLATLFILIILAIAGIYLIKIGMTQLQIVNYNLLSTRAELALESALKITEQNWIINQSCKDNTYSFEKHAKALAGYEVKISCLQSYQFPATNPTFFALQLKAQAQHGNFGERDYVNYQRSKWLVLDKSASIPSQPLK
jgi:Tfp pilus assembly protein PilX